MQKQMLAPCLESWIKKNLELLWLPNIYTPKNFLLPKNVEGMALGSVLLHSEFSPVLPCSPRHVELLIHELIHVRQQQKSLYLPWFLAYGIGWIAAGFDYRKNPFEEYAYQEARRLLGKYMQENPCLCPDFT